MSDIVGVEYYIQLDGETEKIGLVREDDSIVEVYIGLDPGQFIKNEFSGTGNTVITANYDFVHMMLVGNVTITDITCLLETNTFTLICKQDSTGGRIITWPAEIKWPGGVAPVLSTEANAIDVFVFFTIDTGATWYGYEAGLAMAVA